MMQDKITLNIPDFSNPNQKKIVTIRIDNIENFKTDWTVAHYPELFDKETLENIFKSVMIELVKQDISQNGTPKEN